MSAWSGQVANPCCATICCIYWTNPRQRGFKQSIITNGTAFSNEFLAFAARHLDCVQISIDDVGSHYDELKGGDFWELLVSNVRRAVANELPIVGSVVLTEFNVSHSPG